MKNEKRREEVSYLSIHYDYSQTNNIILELNYLERSALALGSLYIPRCLRDTARN